MIVGHIFISNFRLRIIGHEYAMDTRSHRSPNQATAWRCGSERRFYDDHNRKVNGSTPKLVPLLRPWIGCFTMIISAWWNMTCSKLKNSQEI